MTTEHGARSCRHGRSSKMWTNLGFARVAAVAAALLIPAVSGLGTAAFADDEYGVAKEHGALIRQSAESAPSFSDVARLAVGRKPAQTAAAKSAPAASDVSAGNKPDLVATRGQPHHLTRHPHPPRPPPPCQTNTPS